MFRHHSEPVRRRRGGCLLLLIKLALLVALAFVVVTFIMGGPLDRLVRSGLQATLSANTALPGGTVNVLLLGVDAEKEGSIRSDSMLVASMALNGQIKLTSIMRDTLTPIEGYGRKKINAAYAYGGPTLAMKTVNEAFDLNITRYLAIDFSGFAQLIDDVGGVDVDVSEAEMQAMNRDFKSSGKAAYRLNTSGQGTHLTGAQALRYARIRKDDSDYQRASRQRAVLSALYKKIRAIRDPFTLIRVGNFVFGHLETNIAAPELATLCVRALLGGEIETFRVPVDGTFESGTKDGQWTIRPDFDQNRALLHAFLYS